MPRLLDQGLSQCRLPKGLLAAAAAGLLVSGCASIGNRSSAVSELPAGSRIVLEQSLTVAPGRERSYVQGGVAVNRNAVDRFVPYCYFSLNQPVQSPGHRTIKPTTFKTGPVRTGGHAAERSQDGRTVAMRGWPRLAAGGIGGGVNGAVTRVKYITRIPLRSQQQPDVRSLTCAYNGKPLDSHLSLDQIKGVLAPTATVQANSDE